MRWLAGNSHLLAEHGWSLADVGKAVDASEDAMKATESDGTKMLDEDFMMNVFGVTALQVPPFQVFLDHMFDKKRSRVVGDANAKVLPCHRLGPLLRAC